MRGSRLLTGKQVVSIPNPIDTREYKPADKREARMRLSLPIDRRLILVVSQRITDKRKGMDYMVRACEIMAERCPEMKENTSIVILGATRKTMPTSWLFRCVRSAMSATNGRL
mgnify:CR=1 FL=1